MNIKQINEIVANYEKLIDLANHKIRLMEKLDKQYSTCKGIEDIYFDVDLVSVECDDGCCGCYDIHYFSFPIKWLSITDAELEKTVLIEKQLKIEREVKKLEEERSKQQKELEQNEFELYQKLKTKFEQ